MKKNIVSFSIFVTLMIFVLMTSNGYTKDFSSDKSGQIKIKAIQNELELDNLNIKLLGSGDDIMLEGIVSDSRISRYTEQIARQYFSKVFNILTIQKNRFSFQFFASEFHKFQGNYSGSRYLEVLKEGMELENIWFFLIFNQKEVESFQNELRDIFSAKPLKTKIMKTSDIFLADFSNSKNWNYKITLQATSMDNGFFQCKVKILFSHKNTNSTLFEKDIYCRKGEWIALTGLMSDSSLSKENNLNDIILFFQPTSLINTINKTDYNNVDDI